MDIPNLVNDAAALESFYLRLSSKLHGEDRKTALKEAKELLDYVLEPHDHDSNEVILGMAASVTLLLQDNLRFGRPTDRDFIIDTLTDLDTMSDMMHTSEKMHEEEWARRR